MQIKCPKCGFSGNIKDELVPESGRNVSCPKCKTNFQVNKPAVSHEVNKPVVTQENTEANKEPLPRPKAIASPKKSSSGSDFQKLLMPVVIALVFLGIGFFGGYSYHKSKTSINESGFKVNKNSVKKPPSNNSGGAVETPAEPQPQPPAPSGQPHPDYEEWTSDVYTDIGAIDSKVASWKAANLTGLQREDEVKKFGSSMLGTKVKGYFKVINVRSGIYNALLQNMNDGFPDPSYKYILESENYYSGSESSYSQTSVLFGFKENKDFLKSLAKDAKFYGEGMIYAWGWNELFEGYRLDIVNCQVNTSE